MNFILCISLVQIFAQITLSSEVFYCESLRQIILLNDSHVNASTQIITRFKNENSYRPNTNCEWSLNAPNGYRIELFNISMEIQYSPVSAICSTYDYILLSQSNETTSICRDYGGLGSLFSIDNSISLRFKSNFVQEFKGISLSIRVWNSAFDCPLNWYKTKNDQSCFGVYDRVDPLDTSQLKCNFAQSNLASFDSNEELEEVVSSYLTQFNLNKNIFWIGLNDIESKDVFKWLDNTRLSFKANLVSKNTVQENRCFGIEVPRFEGLLSDYSFNRLPCNENTLRLPGLCKMPRQGFVNKYRLPEMVIKKRENPSSLLIFLKIGLPIIAGLLLIVLLTTIIITIIKRCKSNGKYVVSSTEDIDLPTYDEVLKS